MDKELKNIVTERIKLLESIIQKVEEKQEPPIPGKLRISNTGSFPKYYRIMSPDDKIGTYLKKEEYDIAARLAQQKYNDQMIKMAQDEERILKDLLRKYPEKTFDNLYDSFSDLRKALIDPIWIPDEAYVKQWLSQDYSGKGFNSHDDSRYISDSGIRMRSKTEVAIANALDRHKLPFLYELPLFLNGLGRINPDFTILLVHLRKIVIWEHHGLLDDRDYREKYFLKKNAAYLANGFYPGKNLIQTFESLNYPLNIAMIESIINEYLI
ncbi:MAG: hypothetical protein IJM53_03420 [Lachnospiraceae bacterium]|nr:hypothetical protein [Lachnospiraceae bacterium]